MPRHFEWSDREKGTLWYLAERRRTAGRHRMTWNEIADQLDRSSAACQSMYLKMKKDKADAETEEEDEDPDDDEEDATDEDDADSVAQPGASTVDREERKEGGESTARPTAAPRPSRADRRPAADDEKTEPAAASASHSPHASTDADADAADAHPKWPKWSAEEDEALLAAVDRTPLHLDGFTDYWREVATHTNGRSAKACQARFRHLTTQLDQMISEGEDNSWRCHHTCQCKCGRHLFFAHRVAVILHNLRASAHSECDARCGVHEFMPLRQTAVVNTVQQVPPIASQAIDAPAAASSSSARLGHDDPPVKCESENVNGQTRRRSHAPRSSSRDVIRIDCDDDDDDDAADAKDQVWADSHEMSDVPASAPVRESAAATSSRGPDAAASSSWSIASDTSDADMPPLSPLRRDHPASKRARSPTETAENGRTKPEFAGASTPPQPTPTPAAHRDDAHAAAAGSLVDVSSSSSLHPPAAAAASPPSPLSLPSSSAAASSAVRLECKRRLREVEFLCGSHGCLSAATMAYLPCGHYACDKCDAMLRRATDHTCRARDDGQQETCGRPVGQIWKIGPAK